MRTRQIGMIALGILGIVSVSFSLFILYSSSQKDLAVCGDGETEALSVGPFKVMLCEFL